MNGIILINKEKGLTSFQVVNRLKKILNVNKVGHSGTLDPNATGLLVCFIDRSTKLLPFFEAATKEYICRLKLGVKTDTYDVWGEVIEEKKYGVYTQRQVIDVLNSFLGTFMQTPPIYSAIKVNGKKLYQYARENKEVEIKQRKVTIHEIELLEYRDEYIDFRVVCSAGTYIRSMCIDIAEKLNTVGSMAALVRTKVGDFSISDSYLLSDVKSENFNILNNEVVLTDYPFIQYGNIEDVRNGKRIQLDTRDDKVMITDENGVVIACYLRERDNIFKCLRGLW